MCYRMPAVIFSALEDNFCIFIPPQIQNLYLSQICIAAAQILSVSQRYSANYECLSSMSGKRVAVDGEGARYRSRFLKLFKGKV